MEGLPTTIISSGHCYNLFDSHSGDERGLTVIDCTSVLMKLNDIFFNWKIHSSSIFRIQRRQKAYFQIQFIEVTVEPIEKTGISLQFAKNARRENDKEHSGSINKRQQGYYSNLKGSPQHCRINEKKYNMVNCHMRK